MVTTGTRGQPQLAQRLLAADDQLAAVVELDGHQAGRNLNVIGMVFEQFFQCLLGGIDQVVKARFGQTHGGNLYTCLHTASARRYEQRAPNAKYYDLWNCAFNVALPSRSSTLGAVQGPQDATPPQSGLHRQAAGWPVYSGAINAFTKDFAMKRLISALAALVAVACLVSACGQKGPLYLPDGQKSTVEQDNPSKSHKHMM